jgi:hypothetical protein
METMILALEGTLDVVSVADVLRLLAATAKTGQLRLQSDAARGIVWLREGRVTAVTGAEPRRETSTVEFLFWFSMGGRGWFVFEVDDHAPAGPPVEVDQIVADLATLAQEWDELHRVVPSVSHRLGLVDRLPSSEVTIDAQRWPGVLAAASEPTVREIGAGLGLGDLDALRAVRDLVSTGVVEVRPPAGHRTGAVPPQPDAERTPRRPLRAEAAPLVATRR